MKQKHSRIKGTKYNYWTLLGNEEKRNDEVYVECKCNCGTIKFINFKSIIKNVSKSCGCYRKTLYKENKFGMGNTNWKGGKVINSGGYIEIRFNNKYVKEHRYVYEQHYGITLTLNQNIHHINGDRLDNRIENLELWDTSQPKGQRVEDKINFYFSLVEQYKNHPLYKDLISEKFSKNFI
jgi:predicted ribonuclease toxin of YeeF-YezG toxin-antitoxin module